MGGSLGDHCGSFEGGGSHLGTGGSLGDHSWGGHWVITGNFKGGRASTPVSTGGSLWGSQLGGSLWDHCDNFEGAPLQLATGGSLGDGSCGDSPGDHL